MGYFSNKFSKIIKRWGSGVAGEQVRHAPQGAAAYFFSNLKTRFKHKFRPKYTKRYEFFEKL